VEASLSGLLILAGVHPGYAVLAALAYRIAPYWLPLLAGLPALPPPLRTASPRPASPSRPGSTS